MHSILADIVIVIHFLWVGFLVLGFPIALYFNNAFWRLFHFGALIAALAMHITNTLCPLTVLEGYLKSMKISAASYPGDFIPRLLEKWIYVDAVVLKIVTYLIVIYTVMVILSFFLRPVHFQKKRERGAR